jgi:uncharacterized protein DUF541
MAVHIDRLGVIRRLSHSENPAMRLATMTLLILTLAARAGVAQVGGNVGYGQAGGRARAEQNERAKRQLTREEMPPTDTAMFIDASVLMNVKADEFVATFGVAAEAETVEACQEKMNATIAAFTEALKPLGIGPEALFVDFTAQTKVYDYKVEGSLAREHLAGFELKKTVAVRYRDKALIDRLVVAASPSASSPSTSSSGTSSRRGVDRSQRRAPRPQADPIRSCPWPTPGEGRGRHRVIRRGEGEARRRWMPGMGVSPRPSMLTLRVSMAPPELGSPRVACSRLREHGGPRLARRGRGFPAWA